MPCHVTFLCFSRLGEADQLLAGFKISTHSPKKDGLNDRWIQTILRSLKFQHQTCNTIFIPTSTPSSIEFSIINELSLFLKKKKQHQTKPKKTEITEHCQRAKNRGEKFVKIIPKKKLVKIMTESETR
jgi:hypothetical protein